MSKIKFGVLKLLCWMLVCGVISLSGLAFAQSLDVLARVSFDEFLDRAALTLSEEKICSVDSNQTIKVIDDMVQHAIGGEITSRRAAINSLSERLQIIKFDKCDNERMVKSKSLMLDSAINFMKKLRAKYEK
jgi:hypothetical protein